MRPNAACMVIALSLLLTSAAAAHAHVNGLSLEKTVGDHKIDVGFDSTEVSAGETRWVDFWLLNAEATEPRSFDAVWVRISRGEDVTLAATLRPTEEGGAGMLYAFAASGDHEIKVQFLKDYQVLAETSFNVPVAGQLEKKAVSADQAIGIGILAFVGGALAAKLSRRRKKV